MINETVAKMIIAASNNPLLIPILADSLEDYAIRAENGEYLHEHYRRDDVWMIRTEDLQKAKEFLYGATAKELKKTSIEDLCKLLYERHNEKNFMEYIYYTFFPTGVMGLNVRDFTKQQIVIYYFIRGLDAFKIFYPITYITHNRRILIRSVIFVLSILQRIDETNTNKISHKINIFKTYLENDL